MNNTDTQEQLRGAFSAAIAAYEKDNPARSTRQIGIDLGVPDRYNFDGDLEVL